PCLPCHPPPYLKRPDAWLCAALACRVCSPPDRRRQIVRRRRQPQMDPRPFGRRPGRPRRARRGCRPPTGLGLTCDETTPSSERISHVFCMSEEQPWHLFDTSFPTSPNAATSIATGSVLPSTCKQIASR